MTGKILVTRDLLERVKEYVDLDSHTLTELQVALSAPVQQQEPVAAQHKEINMSEHCTCKIANAHNTAAVRKGYEMGGYVLEKCSACLAAAPQSRDDVVKDAARYRWLRHMTTRERIYIVQQVYDKTMDDLLDESMAGVGNE